MLTCTHCQSILADWSGVPYCTPCLRNGSNLLAPRIQPRKPTPPIPLEDTPIYAQLKAERETVTVEIHVDASAFVASLKPLLKNRKARR